MKKPVLILVVVFAAICVAVVGLALAFFFWPGGRSLPTRIYFGLGGRPGAELRFQVQVQDAIEDEADRVIGGLAEELLKTGNAAIDRNEPSTAEQADSIQVNVNGVAPEAAGELRKLAEAKFPDWILTPVNPTGYRLNPRAGALAAWKRLAVEQTISITQSRISELGLMGRVQRGSGAFEITVQLVGSPDDPERLNRFLSTRASLRITAVTDGPFDSQDEALARHGGVLPLSTRLLKALPRGASGEGWYVVSLTPVLTGRDLRNARPGQDDMRRHFTSFSLSPEAGQRFGRFTEANIGNRLAVVLDDRIVSVAVVQSRIEDSGEINGLSTEEEAMDLSRYLRSGSLPARLVALPQKGV